jgi:hypothetical protein
MVREEAVAINEKIWYISNRFIGGFLLISEKGADRMRKGVRVVALFLACSLLLCGCGTSLFELTEEEETVIVHYAAYVLAKHNVYQKDGMVAIDQSLLEEEETVQIGTEDTLPEETETETEEAEQQTASGEAGADSSEEPENTISIAEAAGYDGQLDIVYTGFYTVNNFQEGKAYSLDARSGYDFVVAQFTMTNISGEALDVNIMGSNLTFRMSYDGSTRIKEDVTLLLTDLSTYTGSIESGESVDLVLLFEVPEEEADSVSELAFYVDKDGENYIIR